MFGRRRLLFTLLIVVVIVIIYNLQNINNTNEPVIKSQPMLQAQSSEDNLIPFKTTSYIFYKHRVRLWYEGRCIDVTSEGKLVIAFCDPDVQQAFSMKRDYRLVYERLGKCVDYDKADLSLILVECSMVSGAFTIRNTEGVFLRRIVGDKELCVTPVSPQRGGVASSSPCLYDPVRLTPCDKIASRLILMEEKVFQEDRKLLKQVVAPTGSSCDFKACGLNQRDPVTLLPQDQIKRCTKLWECVTLVVKTARRPHLILRQAKSVRNKLGFDLPTVVYDDGPDDYSAETRGDIAEYPLLRYIVGHDEDLGIARGRDLALLQVQTKYFFLLDDDITFTEHTNIAKLVEILDTTDATVASASYENGGLFTAFLEFGYFSTKKSRLGMFKGLCARANQTIPNFPSCVRCETSPNVFLARTQQIKDIGGWDPELMILEHKDIFIRLKAAGMKLAHCDDVKLRHSRPSKGTEGQGEGYLEKRKRDGAYRYRALMCNRWNVQFIFERQPTDPVQIDDDGQIIYHGLYNNGYC